jgi:hypothetical protein
MKIYPKLVEGQIQQDAPGRPQESHWMMSHEPNPFREHCREAITDRVRQHVFAN